MEPVAGASAASPAVPNTAAPIEPAEPVAAVAASTGPKKALTDLTADERREWRMSGKLPDAPAASSTATATEVPPAGTPAISQSASEPTDDDPEYKPKTKRRIQELLTKISSLEAAARTPAAAPAVPAVSAPAPAASTLTEPDPDAFTYGTADPAYLKALTTYAVQKAHEDQQAATTAAARKTASEDTARRIQESWKTRVAAAQVKHADFDAVALQQATKIPPGSLIDSWVLESEHGADVLYDLQKNPAEVDRLLKLSPLAQTRELVKLEERLIADQPKLVTSAPDPGQTLTARGADPLGTDPVRRAVRKRDTGAYLKEANERDLAARRPRK